MPFVNKEELNTNRTTNATGLLSAFGGLFAVVEGITHGQPAWVWVPTLCVSLSGAISQWLQGTPSTETKLIARVLDLKPGMTNADLAHSLVSRFIKPSAASTATPDGPYAYDRPPAMVPTPAPPEVISQAWGEADRLRAKFAEAPIEGARGMTPSQYAAYSMADEEDPITQF